MRVRITFTVDANYEDYVAVMKQSGQVPFVAKFRDNLQGLAEESFTHAMEDYVGFQFVDERK